MQTFNIHDAKTNLSRLVDMAVNGEPFIIAKAGKPMVKVTAIGVEDSPRPRIGFMRGLVSVPANFDELGREEIEGLFEGRR